MHSPFGVQLPLSPRSQNWLWRESLPGTTCFPPFPLLKGTKAAGLGHPRTASAPTYPEGVSFQGAHHGQKKGLLQEGKEGADERLQPSQAAKLRGRIPGGGKGQVTHMPAAAELPSGQVPWGWRSG